MPVNTEAGVLFLAALPAALSARGKGQTGVRIEDLLSETQDGRAFSNLARAFHLEPSKVEVAVAAMIRELAFYIERNAGSRHWLGNFVHNLGLDGYQKILTSPSLLGATSTQVLGNDALEVIAGRGAKEKIAEHAARAAGISEMISEYLLPVVAAMMIGIIAKQSEPAMDGVMLSALGESPPPRESGDSGNDSGPGQLPLPSGGVGFTGSTGVVSNAAAAVHDVGRYDDLADVIRREPPSGGDADPARDVRRLLAIVLGYPTHPLLWVGRIQQWGKDAVKSLLSGRRY